MKRQWKSHTEWQNNLPVEWQQKSHVRRLANLTAEWQQKTYLLLTADQPDVGVAATRMALLTAG